MLKIKTPIAKMIPRPATVQIGRNNARGIFRMTVFCRELSLGTTPSKEENDTILLYKKVSTVLPRDSIKIMSKIISK